MNGQKYEPDTFYILFRSFDRYLKEKGQQQRLLLDSEFKTAYQVIEAKRKELQKQGLGKKECAAEPISDKEEDLLLVNSLENTHFTRCCKQCGIST